MYSISRHLLRSVSEKDHPTSSNPGKRNHEQSEHPESPHTEQRPSKKAKEGTQKAAITTAEEEAATAAKAAEEEAAEEGTEQHSRIIITGLCAMGVCNRSGAWCNNK